MLRLCRHRQRARSIPVAGNRSDIPSETTISSFLTQLESLYDAFLTKQNLTPNATPLIRREQDTFVTPDILPDDDSSTEYTELAYLHPKLRSSFGTMAQAYFHAAIILLVKEHTSQPCPSSEKPCKFCDAVDTTYNAQTIIAAGRLLSTPALCESNGTAIMRMRLPFSVVWRHCTDDEMRWKARRLFEDWCSREGLKGLKDVGFEGSSREPQGQAELLHNSSIETHAQ